MKAKIKNFEVFSIKKGEIVEIEKDFKSYVICIYNGNKHRVDKKNLEFLNSKK